MWSANKDQICFPRLFVRQSIYLPVGLSACPSIRLSASPSVRMFFSQFVCFVFLFEAKNDKMRGQRIEQARERRQNERENEQNERAKNQTIAECETEIEKHNKQTTTNKNHRGTCPEQPAQRWLNKNTIQCLLLFGSSHCVLRWVWCWLWCGCFCCWALLSLTFFCHAWFWPKSCEKLRESFHGGEMLTRIFQLFWNYWAQNHTYTYPFLMFCYYIWRVICLRVLSVTLLQVTCSLMNTLTFFNLGHPF